MNIMPMVDYAAKTIILTEAFSRAARAPFSDAFNQLARLREALPGFEVVVREHRRPRITPRTQNIPKFVSYEKMEAYIRLLPDGDALMERYRLVRAFAKCRRNSASIVFRWFPSSSSALLSPPRAASRRWGRGPPAQPRGRRQSDGRPCPDAAVCDSRESSR